MDKTKSLLSAIQRTPISPVAPAVVSDPLPAKSSGRGSRVGKPVQFWMHEEDRKILRELAAWLASQGLRPSDSLVIRAALRSAVPGPSLLEAYRAASQCDGRLKHNQTPVST